ncbi:hypothetical protein [Peribacillus butanolivorans]
MNGFKILDKIAPFVPVVENTVTDRSTLITGKAVSNAKVFAKGGNKKLAKQFREMVHI